MNKTDLTSRAAKALGIKQFTNGQKQMLELAPELNNIVMISPTGSGKTLAFVLNTATAMTETRDKPQTLVVVPSRELALQVGEVFRQLTAGVYKTVVCYGGHPFAEEERSIKAGSDIIVSTPGRVLDHIRRGTFDASTIHFLVIDEYDKALELGFADEMSCIMRALTGLRRMVLTSATELQEWPEWLDRSHSIRVGDSETTPHTPQADGTLAVIEVPSYERDKLAVLDNLLRTTAGERTIIFVNHRESAERVATFLLRIGYPAALYHGGLEQIDRENSLEMFVNGSRPVLVSTDLGSRGLDITGVENVVHYHMPVSEQAWTHRNGRTARMGASGRVYVIVAEGESVPDYIHFDRTWNPPMAPADQAPFESETVTLWFGAGKKDKLSRGDIVGYLTKAAGLPASAIGHILLRDHNALVAVGADYADAVMQAAVDTKIKGKKARVSRLG